MDNYEDTDTTEIKKAELMQADVKTTGIVQKNKNEFFYYPDTRLTFDDQEIDYFHFKRPSLKKAKANNVVLSNALSARDLESMLRASLLRIAKKSGGEFLSCNFKDIIEDLPMDDATEMANGCSAFFVKGAE